MTRGSKSSSFLSKLKPGSKVPSSTKSVWMPRGEYRKHFAKDKEGNYVGEEPQKEWTEEELEERCGRYRKTL